MIEVSSATGYHHGEESLVKAGTLLICFGSPATWRVQAVQRRLSFCAGRPSTSFDGFSHQCE